MGSRRARGVVTAVVAILVGVASAYVVHGFRNSPVASTPPSPSASAAESPSPSPLESPSPAESPSPPAESPSPVAPRPSPSPTETPKPPGPAQYPPQITAGSTYSYRGTGTMTVLASDRQDVGTSACAGIDETNVVPPPGYATFFYVSIQFGDGNILAAGYVRNVAGRHDFASVQRGGTSNGVAGAPGSLSPGSHTYCVTRSGNQWVMTDDGTTIYTTTAEPASSTQGASVQFHSSAGKDPASPSPTTQKYNLVVPGFHDLMVGGKPPTQLVGQGPIYT